MTNIQIKGPWTDTENSACIALYFDMLDNATQGIAYSKAAMIRVARGETAIDPAQFAQPWAGKLSNRSRGSIEAKLMNCSAAHRDLAPHAVTMSGFGYRPLPNYQGALKQAMADYIAEHACDTEKALIGFAQ